MADTIAESGSASQRAFISAVGLSENEEGPLVKSLQHYLQELGYLSLGETTQTTSQEGEEGAYNRIAIVGRFDEATTTALAHYQRFFKLPETGKLDEITLTHMRRPRCGNPDILSENALSSEKKLVTNPWGKNNLSFCIPKVPSTAQEPELDTVQKCSDAFQRGFSIWSIEANIPIRFHLAQAGEVCDITIAFGFPQCGGDACTDCPPDGTPLGMVYDVREKWSPSPPPNPEPIDVIAFACHEVGHALGLCRHSANEDAIMYAIIPNLKRHLLANGDDNDVDRIRTIYGQNFGDNNLNSELNIETRHRR
jgi:predicted Zn-dependent protease